MSEAARASSQPSTETTGGANVRIELRRSGGGEPLPSPPPLRWWEFVLTAAGVLCVLAVLVLYGESLLQIGLVGLAVVCVVFLVVMALLFGLFGTAELAAKSVALLIGRDRYQRLAYWFRESLDLVSEDPEVIAIKPRAFLLTMLAIAWCSLRHPLTVTRVDLATGRVIDDL